jgi:hypothetical protein
VQYQSEESSTQGFSLTTDVSQLQESIAPHTRAVPLATGKAAGERTGGDRGEVRDLGGGWLDASFPDQTQAMVERFVGRDAAQSPRTSSLGLFYMKAH